MTRDEVLSTVADWIDPWVIAEAIADHVENELGAALTVEECQQTWLRELRNLCG